MASSSLVERTAVAALIAGTAWLGYVTWELTSQYKALHRALDEGSRRTATVEEPLLTECYEAVRRNIAYAVSETSTDEVQRLIRSAQPLPHVVFVQRMREALYDAADLPFDGTSPIRRLDIDECIAAYAALRSPELRATYVRNLNDLLEKR